ncbi:hypothetical protein [Staphylococcus debuckii]|uniref:Uncharacterized protein n=1 Tax=Staphylococcus debuckii TaxID=2044912 RepID=A0ABU9EW19_9STAP|nr:hypothetical protein [Staphylococcus debuckii]AYU55134.1 hypothetical protein CNQ82_06640 [Staphylococcus debuckii]
MPNKQKIKSYLNEKVEFINETFDDLYQNEINPNNKDISKSEIILLSEIFSTLEAVDGFVSTHDDVENLEFKSFAQEARKFYDELAKVASDESKDKSHLGEAFESYLNKYEDVVAKINEL